MFPTTKLFRVANSMSNHSMLILKNTNPTGRQKKRAKLFRFESMWLRDERCSVVVFDDWERGRILGTDWPLLHCLEECRVSLTEWNKHSFGHVGKQIFDLQRKLQLLENMKGGESTLEDIHAMKKELNSSLALHLEVEDLGVAGGGGGDESGVKELEDSVADVGELRLDLGFVVPDHGHVVLVAAALLLLLDRGDDAPQCSPCADLVLVRHGEKVSLLDGVLLDLHHR
nr:hypothetical protein CFP56_71808 [Quercus suber]